RPPASSGPGGSLEPDRDFIASRVQFERALEMTPRLGVTARTLVYPAQRYVDVDVLLGHRKRTLEKATGLRQPVFPLRREAGHQQRVGVVREPREPDVGRAPRLRHLVRPEGQARETELAVDLRRIQRHRL